MANKLEQLEMRIAKLERENQRLRQGFTIPFNEQKALEARLLPSFLGATITVSAKDINSEDQAVSEAGTANYNVMKDPDLFLQTTIDNVTYYFPVFV